MPPEYTYVSWLRQGLAAQIAADDRLGSNPDMGPAGRATLPVELTLDVTDAQGAPVTPPPTVQRDISMLGPHDVGAVKAEAIIRTQPADRTLGATPGELAYVEFYDEDFPWRYTPARAAGSRLRPWIALLVLTPNEFELREPVRQDALPVLTYAADVPLPPRTETWAWAHAQLSRVVATPAEVDAEIRGHPDLALSRLLSPRRLLPSTEYHAFLVPSLEAGRLAGLARDASEAPTQKPAWGTPSHADDRDLPVYHRFTFATGTAGDFETLARKLRPEPAGERFGKRPLDVSEPGFGMTPRPGTSVELEGALAPIDFERTDFPESPGSTVAAELGRIVDAGESQRTGPAASVPADPLVVPPVYGRWHAGVPRVADASSRTSLAWLAELNLDLRNRATAGLGSEVVREGQEELVQRAWEQVGAIEAANQRLREAELARSAAEAVMRKHVAQAGDPDRLLVLTSAAHAGLAAPGAGGSRSIRGAVDASRVPAAAAAPAFRRITRPQRPLMRRLTGTTELTGFQAGLLTGMNADPEAALSTAPPAADPAPSVELQSVRDAVNTAVGELQELQLRPDRVFIELARAELVARLDSQGNLVAPSAAALGAAIVTRVDARFPPATASAEQLAVAARVKRLAVGDAATGVQGITAVAAAAEGTAEITIQEATFEAEYGDRVRGKTAGGVTVLNSNPPADGEIARLAELADVQNYASSLGSFETSVVAARPDPPPRDPLTASSQLAHGVVGALAPQHTIGDRLAAALPVLAERDADDPQRLAPVMAHPQFRDPMFEPLRALSQDHIIPNGSDLPRDSLTLMEPNPRFIESYLAGANHAFAQELLWREYPTDRRGTYFRVFWDTRDALSAPDRDDIEALPDWDGALGSQSPLPPGVLVLVVRGELLEKYPSTFIYAQEAMWPGTDTGQPRVLDPAGEVQHPIFHARLLPDITIVGFDLDEDTARGHRPLAGDTRPARPGWFFVLMERPGEPRFGLDDATPATGLQTWNDLAWDALSFPAGTPYVELAANAALTPATAQAAQWGRTAADMAAILFQSPVLLARHASEMLP